MQAIVTKYLGPTNSRGSRIKATADAGSITVPYPHDKSGEDCHRVAVDALVKKLGWNTPEYPPLVSGGLPGNGGYVFVFLPNNAQSEVQTALGNLLQFCAGNRGNREGNPYSKPEVRDALKALFYAQNGYRSDEWSDYSNAADTYKTIAPPVDLTKPPVPMIAGVIVQDDPRSNAEIMEEARDRIAAKRVRIAKNLASK